MIKEIRSYLKAQIRGVDSGLKENKSVFYDSDIGETLLDRSFQIELNNISNISRDSHFSDTIETTIIICGIGKNRDKQLDNYDNLLCKAQYIRDSIIDIKNFTGSGNIVNINAGTIVSEQLPDNDNSFRININLTLSLAYSRGE